MTMQVNQSIVLSAIFYSFVYLLAMPVAGAEELVTFNPGLNEFPESVSADVSGNVYVSLRGEKGEIRRIKPNGEMVLHFQLDPCRLKVHWVFWGYLPMVRISYLPPSPVSIPLPMVFGWSSAMARPTGLRVRKI